ncbi:MAG TPA: GntG family PLP-dependent aldolase [Gemmatimonadaceae bacterium]|nr:GntG family PLP-dependent aldolase [Gemmatimonadaceae bacterium]
MQIDLRSDTVTRPTPAMRQAMASADVGDDVLDGDPTVRRLEERVAELLGKEKALFFPTGTMANQSGVWLLSRPGTEILLDEGAHIIHYEYAGAAALSGVQVRPVSGSGPVMDADALSAAIRPTSRVAPAASMVCLENTHNGAGGKITSLGELRALHDLAKEHGLGIHLDGARLWNASVASGTSLSDFAACADTVMVSFSKGLGAPVGAALAGPADLIEEGWTVRKRFGGGMRQSGILAAAVLHALDHHMARLSDDHANARAFAAIVDGAAGACVVPPDTNIVMIDLPTGLDAFAIVPALARRGVLTAPWSSTRIRAVFHLDVDAGGAREAAEVMREVLARGE